MSPTPPRTLLERVQLGRIRKGLSTPTLLGRELNRIYHSRAGRRSYNPEGVDLFAADWDTLAVADACRYDVFADCHTLPGQLEARQSRAASTPEWLRANFDGDHRDTVYVTANPKFAEHRETLDVQFHAVKEVWRGDGWDDDLGTVRPETVTAAAIEAADRHPNKRLLVHYLQPHCPFIGPVGREQFAGKFHAFWNRVLDGRVEASTSLLRKVYRENFEAMLPALDELLDARSGRTVVTADHGQLLGERSFPIPVLEFGHPRENYVKNLVKVPWLVHESGERPSIEMDEDTATSQQQGYDNANLNNRLAALGYAENE